MSQSNVETIQQVYAACGRGDVPAILERVSDDTTWSFNATTANVPWRKTTRGKAELPQFFSRLAENTDFQVFEPRRFMHSGNDVTSEVRMEYTVKSTGKKVKEDALFSGGHSTMPARSPGLSISKTLVRCNAPAHDAAAGLG